MWLVNRAKYSQTTPKESLQVTILNKRPGEPALVVAGRANAFN